MPEQQQLYGLTDEDRRLLRRWLEWADSFRKETSPAPLKYRPPLENIMAYLLADLPGAIGDITSGGGLTPGTGTAQRCFWNGTVWKPTSDNPYTVHNLGLTWYPANAQVELAKVNGIWTVVELDTGVGKASEDIANGTSGTVEIYWGTLPSTTDSTNSQAMFNPSVDITEGDTVRWGRTNGQYECIKICTSGSSGSVTSVGLTMPSGFAVASSPVISTGTIAVTTSLSGVAIGTGSGFSTATIGGNLHYASSTINLANDVSIASTLTVPNTGFKITDAGASAHPLTISTSATYSHDTTLSINTVPLVSGGGTIYDWTLTVENNVALNQNLLTTSNVIFATAGISGKCIMGAFSLGGASQLVTLTGNVNNLALTDAASIVALNATGNFSITGLSATDNTVWYEVYNGSTTHTITLSHENAGSTTFNRFHFASGADLAIPPLASVMIYYPDSRWRLVNDQIAAGSVTSVGLAVPSGLTSSGGPVTGTGTLTISTTLSGVILGNGSGFTAVTIPSDATQFLNGAATPAYANVKDSDLSTSDITTNNVSITKHGFTPKLPNDASKFLDGTGAYSVPSGSGVTFANPAASIGLSAVNGVASTAMRSDSAPALDVSISPTWTGSHTFGNAGFFIKGVGGSHALEIAPGSTLTANRQLTLTTGDFARTITLQGDPTLSDWFDQAVKSVSSPSFANVTDTGLTASLPVFTDGSKTLTSTGTVGTAHGGTGVTSTTDGQLLIGNTSSGNWSASTLTAGANVTITNAGGSITIAAAGGGGGGSFTGPISIVSAHGFSGSVANATTVGTITLNCSVNAPVLQANGTSISAATTTGSGSTVVLASGPSIASSITLTGTSPTLLLTDSGGTHTFGLSCTGALSSNRRLSFDFDNDCNLSLGGDFSTGGSLALPSVAQGDSWYGSSAGNVSALAKNTTATRYYANTGTSNNPKWDTVNLSNGVSNTLAVGNGGTGQTSYTDGQLLIGNTTGNTLSLSTLTAGTGIGITNGHGTITITNTGGGGGGGGSVTSIDITQPSQGITFTGGPITVSGAIVCALANDLGAIEALTGSGIAARTGTDTWALRTITGTSGFIDVNNGDGIAGNPTVNISASYAGQNTIVTLGTVTTGTWLGTTIISSHGGTGYSSYTDGQLLIGSTASGLLQGTLTAGDGITITNGSGSITAAANTQMSLTANGSGLKLVNDNATPSANSVYSYVSSAKNWNTINALLQTISGYDGTAAHQFIQSSTGSLSWNAAANFSTTAPLAGGGDISGDRTLSITGAAGKVLAGSGPAFTATPTLGVASSITGTLALANSGNSGVATIQYQSSANNPTLTLPNQTGTFAVKATSPLNLSSTSGQLSIANAAADGATLGAASFDSSTFTDNGVGNISAKTQMSVTSNASGLKLSGDSATPGNSMYYGTNSGGTKGWYALPGGGGGLSGSGTDNHLAMWTSSGTALADTNIETATHKLFDAGTSASPNGIDFAAMKLLASGIATLNWSAATGYNTSGTLTLNWDGEELIESSSGVAVVKWGAQQLIDTSGNIRLQWNGSDTIQLGGVTGSLHLSDGVHSSDIKFGSGATFDIVDSGVTAIAPGAAGNYIKVKVAGTNYKLPLV